MNLIESMIATFQKAGFPSKLVDAPKDAVTFDKMLIVFSTQTMKTIRQVHLFSTKENKFIGSY